MMGHFPYYIRTLQQNLHAGRNCWLSRFRKHESAAYRMLESSVIRIMPQACSENSA